MHIYQIFCIIIVKKILILRNIPSIKDNKDIGKWI